jgi:hypothetical protein
MLFAQQESALVTLLHQVVQAINQMTVAGSGETFPSDLMVYVAPYVSYSLLPVRNMALHCVFAWVSDGHAARSRFLLDRGIVMGLKDSLRLDNSPLQLLTLMVLENLCSDEYNALHLGRDTDLLILVDKVLCSSTTTISMQHRRAALSLFVRMSQFGFALWGVVNGVLGFALLPETTTTDVPALAACLLYNLVHATSFSISYLVGVDQALWDARLHTLLTTCQAIDKTSPHATFSHKIALQLLNVLSAHYARFGF